MSSQREILRTALEDYKDNPPMLIDIILQQSEMITELSLKVTQQAKQITELMDRMEEAERELKRQAAPFRKSEDKKVQHPKRPGRKGGHKGEYRQPSGDLNERVEVTLPEACPNCGEGKIGYVQRVRQVIEEIAPPQPRIVELITYAGECLCCGHEITTDHPLKVSHGQGASAVHLGPRATATALRLQHEYGLTKGKAAKAMGDLFGLPLTKGGLIHLNYRMASALAPDYEALLEQARQSDQVNVDETSWWMGGPAFLWVVANPEFTLFHVDPTRARAVIQSILGKDYAGILTSDCLSVYDNEVANKQQKCYAHHLKAISQAIRTHAQQGKGYLLTVKELLQEAIALGKKRASLAKEKYDQLCARLEQRANELFSIDPRGDPVEQRINNRIFKQRDHLFTFLYHPGIDPTNNLAERQLRPAVIARKVSCGNRTAKGAQAWQVNASLVVTYNQNDLCVESAVAKALKRRL